MSRIARRHTRIRARGVAAHLRTQHGRTACQVENVSMGGVFVRTDHLEEVGTEISIDLVKPGWKRQLTLTARVTSRVDAIDGRLSKRMPGMGLQILRLDDKQHDRLLALLRELGATEEDLQVTLPDESAEPELRALDLEVSPSDAETLDPQPQPLWQQVQMVEAERRGVLVDDIEGAVRDANLPPPGPVVLAAAKQPAPQPGPDRTPARASEPARAPASSPAPSRDLEIERLMVQIRGLVMQHSEALQQVAQRDLEIQRLKDELDSLRSALERSVRKA
jgi:hypothetical protein